MTIATIGFYLVFVVFIIICVMLILVILAQEGKGGGLSGIGGSAALGETFGFGGAATAMRKWTRNIAIAFVVLVVVLTFWGEQISGRNRSSFLEEGATPDAASAALPPGAGPAPIEGGQPASRPMPRASVSTEAAPEAAPAGALTEPATAPTAPAPAAPTPATAE